MKRIELPPGDIGFTADQHIGNHGRFGGRLRGGLNNRCRLAISGLRLASHELRACTAHVLLGDLFDTNRPRPAIICATQRVLAGGPQPVILLGNHDYASADQYDNAIAPLAPIAELVQEPTILGVGDVEVWCVPFIESEQPFEERITSYLKQFSKARKSEICVLALHVGISDEHTPPWLRDSDCLRVSIAAELADTYSISRVISGDWHEHRSWIAGRIIQCGALVPTGFDNPGLDYGYVHTIDQHGALSSQRVPGPRFIKAHSVDELRLPDEGGLVYVQLDVGADDYQEQCRQLDELTQSSVIAGGAVRVDRSELQSDARHAASAVRASSSISEAAHKFVHAMSVDKSVDRLSVSARVLAFIETARGTATGGGASIAVRQIQMSGFASYDAEMTLHVPQHGLIVVDGDNGCGKTAIIEVVSHVCWDQSIKDRARGCWRDLRDGSVASVQLADGTWVTRKKERGRKRVRVIGPGEVGVEFDQPTRMKDQLAAQFGQFSVWRNTCVFTSSSGSFTGATDGQRKRMLEAVLGVAVFDQALALCRTEIKSLNATLASAGAKGQTLEERKRGLGRRLTDHQVQLAGIDAEVITLSLPNTPTPPTPVPVEAVDLDQAHDSHMLAEFDLEDASLARAQTQAELGELQRRLRGLDTRSECPACGSSLDATEAVRHAAQLDTEINQLTASRTRDVQVERQATERLQGARAWVSKAERAQSARKSNQRIADQHQAHLAQWQRRCDELRAAWHERVAGQAQRRLCVAEQLKLIEVETFDVDSEIEDLTVELARLNKLGGELGAAEVALGLRGIRANVMTDLLATVERLANRWLEELGSLQVRLRPFTPTSTSGVKDEIHLEIEGAGGGHYGDASQGQQRRIDIAILLALAEAAGGLDTADRSTLFFDEVFDALDPQGQRGMAKILRELSQDRACVVITHVPSLAAELRPDITVTVTAQVDPDHPEQGPRHARLSVRRTGSRIAAA